MIFDKKLFALLMIFSFMFLACCGVVSGLDKGGDIRDEWTRLSNMPQTPEVLERKRQLYMEIMERYSNYGKKRFDISGMVVDGEGKQLDQVRVVYGMGTHIGWEGNRESDLGETVFDGTYRIQGGPSHWIHAAFFKDGYYSESIQVSGPEIDDIDRYVMEGKPPLSSNVQMNNYNVTLIKKGEVAKLVRRRVFLSYGINGDARVVDVRVPDEGVLPEKRISNAANISIADGSGIIYITSPIDEGAKAFAVDSYPYEGIGLKRTARLPSKIKLSTADLEGGFLPIDYDKILLNKKSRKGVLSYISIKMGAAPETGYMRAWEMTPDIFSKPVFFYFKINGKYGKGQVRGTGVLDGGVVLGLQLDLRIQPDGSRNLETEEW